MTMATARTKRSIHASTCLAMFEPLESRRLLSATYYVSRRGNDANTGTDPTHAWKTIQQAMNAATPGSTVLVSAGLYNQKLTVNVSGDATDGYITFQAVGHVTISGLRQPGANIINLNNQNYIQIVGFNIQDDLNVNDGSGIRMNGHDDHINLLNNSIHNIRGINAMGITAYGTDPINGISNLTISGNQIYQCQPAVSEALTVNGNVHEFEISNNYVHDVNNIGIDCIGGEGMSPNPSTDFARNGTVFGNKVTRVHFTGAGRDGAGIFVDGGQNIIVERNTSWRNDVGIEVNATSSTATATNVIVRDNYVFSNNGAGISLGASQQGDGTVTACQVLNNTIFHDELRLRSDGELRLQVGSNNLVENNVIAGTRGHALLDGEFGSFQNTVDYNLYYSPDGASTLFAWDGFPYRGLAFLQTGVHQDLNSIFANPLLLNPGALRPRMSPRSPVIDRGNPTLSPADGETDFIGNSRLLGNAMDIGAVEVA
ncbi:MAG TPA: right-handed parallel beta-helix repeat-containing protein [Tepidisphaeraceae bacterium]|nr:right-handed parallel beta-helix repeat-containing protein [Tepidisphaeraceae bacterium]